MYLLGRFHTLRPLECLLGTIHTPRPIGLPAGSLLQYSTLPNHLNFLPALCIYWVPYSQISYTTFLLCVFADNSPHPQAPELPTGSVYLLITPHSPRCLKYQLSSICVLAGNLPFSQPHWTTFSHHEQHSGSVYCLPTLYSAILPEHSAGSVCWLGSIHTPTPICVFAESTHLGPWTTSWLCVFTESIPLSQAPWTTRHALCMWCLKLHRVLLCW